jgi:serine/threonine protein kinase
MDSPNSDVSTEDGSGDVHGGNEKSVCKVDSIEMCSTEIPPESLVLQEVVGSGVTAEVYKGFYDGKLVAVKRFTDPRAMQDKYINREVQALLRLKHPNIVRLYGLCNAPDGIQLVAAFCQGGTLFELLHITDIDLCFNQQMKMGTDVAMGMQYLHEYSPPIVHRDLKSLNLLLQKPVSSHRDTPMVQVADFGMSRMIEARQSNTMTKCVGTMQWMAPECISSRTYDLMVDIYSYGVCLYEIMAREPPYFELDEGTKIEDYVMKGGRPDLEAIPLDTPKAIFSLVEECWIGDHKKRPTFREIRERLDAVQPQSQRAESKGAIKAQAPSTPGGKGNSKGEVAAARRKAYYTRKGYSSKMMAIGEEKMRSVAL